MVGYDPSTPTAATLSPAYHSAAGIISGFLTRFLCQPLDVLKIRFQLQHEPLTPGKTGGYYWGMGHALRRIWAEESVHALWKGHLPAQLLSGVYGLAQFSTFEILTKNIYFHIGGAAGASTDFICGSLAGAVGTIISMPCDTIRTRLVGQGEPKIYRGLLHASSSMIRNEGFFSFYKGLSPSLLAIMPQTGVQFTVFRFLSQNYTKKFETNASKKLPLNINLLIGSIAGLVSKTAVYPLDLSKKRLQVQGFEEARLKFGAVGKYRGLGHCLLLTVKDEGILGLYKGLWPSLIKAGITSGLTFGLYEEIIYIFIKLQQ